MKNMVIEVLKEGKSAGVELAEFNSWQFARHERLTAAFFDQIGIALGLPVQLISVEEGRAERKTAARDRLLNDEGIAELRKVCVAKIVKSADDGRLGKCRALMGILYQWKEWAGDEGPRGFLARLVETDSGAIRAVRTFVQQSFSQGWGDYVARKHRSYG